jgi:tRNA (cytidine/uridine-2'-O-)-methyltransferase
LHLVEPLGFSIDAHAVRRAGLDYWHLVEIHTHPNLASAQADVTLRAAPVQPRFWFLSGKAEKSYLDVQFERGDAFVFGKESVGLSGDLLHENADSVIGIPTIGAVRSLNLANSVAIVLYEALRSLGALHVVTTMPE